VGEHVAQVVESILDPLDRRRLEDLLATLAQPGDIVGQRLDASLGLYQRLCKRLAAASLADEVDEVGEAAAAQPKVLLPSV
jgi:hypothetical protein